MSFLKYKQLLTQLFQSCGGCGGTFSIKHALSGILIWWANCLLSHTVLVTCVAHCYNIM